MFAMQNNIAELIKKKTKCDGRQLNHNVKIHDEACKQKNESITNCPIWNDA